MHILLLFGALAAAARGGDAPKWWFVVYALQLAYEFEHARTLLCLAAWFMAMVILHGPPRRD